MTTQGSPDALSSDNALICEKLLGWKKTPWFDGWAGNWTMPDDVVHAGTPCFDTWADAGLILAALDERDIDVEIGNGLKDGVGGWYCRLTGMRLNDSPFSKSAPMAIRAAALTYIRSQP